MLEGPHPPEVVTLLSPDLRQRHRGGAETPDTRSTLSSTPNSPRSPSRRMEAKDLVAAVSSALEDPGASRRKTEVPFDEKGNRAALPPKMVTIGPDDEKKMDEVDELMGRNSSVRHRSFPSTPSWKRGYAGSTHPVTPVTPPGNHRSQPVRLSGYLRETAVAGGRDHDDETMSQPPSLSESRTWAAGEGEPGAIPTRANGEEDCPDDEPLLSHSSSSLLHRRLQAERPSNKLEDMLRTPVQDLKSPPKFLKRNTNKPWKTPPDTEEAPLDEIRDIENTSSLRSMVSPDGKLEFRKGVGLSRSRTGENSILNHDTYDDLSTGELSDGVTNTDTAEGALTEFAVSLGDVVGMATTEAVTLVSDLVLMNKNVCGGGNGSDDESGAEAVSSPIYSVASPSHYQPKTWGEDRENETLSPSVSARRGAEPAKPRVYDAPPGPSLTGTTDPRKPKVYDAPPGPSLAGKTSNGDWSKYLKPGKDGEPSSGYREATPKKDLQASEKSAAWLQEEFRRRSTIKEEINAAIVSRNDQGPVAAPVEDETPMDEFMDTKKQTGALPAALTLNKSGLDVSIQSEDAEVAAITTTNQGRAASSDALISKYAALMASQSDDGAPKPRRLDYGGEPDEGSQPGRITSSSHAAHASYNQHRVLASPDGKTRPPREGGNLQHEMQRFASDTRAALREKEQGGMKEPDSPFRSLAITPSNGESEAASQPLRKTGGHSARTTVPRGTETVSSEASGGIDISTTPALVQSMDSALGIAIGDITLSLLNENTGRTDSSRKATWANRVHSAIWRCRRMRREMGGFPPLPVDPQAGSPSRGRTSLPVDMDKARVAGGVRSIESTQEAALNHLKHDEIEEALELFEDIIFAYYAYFERSLKEREANPGSQGVAATTDFRPYIGVALHNLGILNLLNGRYQEAVSYFTRSIDNRIACLGEGHPDHVASLVKLATCHYALNEFAEAHAKFEQALVFARRSARTLEDRVQMAEILNNLGCLAYMCGQPGAANAFFRESLDVQFGVLSHSLYIDTALVGQSITLSISITRANIGFVKLVTKDLTVAITALENALMEQQILLRGANDTVIATMDHLAVANLLHGDQNKSAMMFGRILSLQQQEYGPHDRRCFVTVDKINMVRSRGTNFERAIEELRKTFTLPDISRSPQGQLSPKSKGIPPLPHGHQSPGKTKGQKNKVMKVLKSIRKKKP